MALAYALHYIKQNNMATIINYGQFLEKFPPQQEAQIFERSSWSCAHGVSRWIGRLRLQQRHVAARLEPELAPAVARGDRRLLRDTLIEPFEMFMLQYTDDIWGMRDAYIDVILDRSPERHQASICALGEARAVRPDRARSWQYAQGDGDAAEPAARLYQLRVVFRRDCRASRRCRILQYVARALELANEVLGIDKEEETFLDQLALSAVEH